MRILITGAAGFIGSHLADRLLAEGHEVHGWDNLLTGHVGNVSNGVRFSTNDIAEGNWAEAWPHAELVIHCAASYSDRNKWHRDTQTNVEGTINIATRAKNDGARVIYFQTALIYGNNPYTDWPDAIRPGKENKLDVSPWMFGNGAWPLKIDTAVAPENSYAISKYAGGQYLRHSGVPLLELRLANIYGPRNLSGPIPTFYKRLAAGEPCTITDSRRDFVYINDLVDLVMAAIEREATGTYHVSTGTDYAIKDVYAAVADNVASEGEYTVVARGADDAPTILLDPSQTEKDFGWKASTPLREGVAAAGEWYAEHGIENTFTHLAVKG